LQSFAIDDLVCPTGFFMSRYNVIDISDYLDIVFTAVDVPCVDNCISLMQNTILPHSFQTLRMFDGVTAQQRALATAEDIMGPLLMLFEFSELECVYKIDPKFRPLLLFGGQTNAIGQEEELRTDESDLRSVGVAQGVGLRDWESKTVGNSLHAVLEACEPTSGIRYC
jgi:hypothetical protein